MKIFATLSPYYKAYTWGKRVYNIAKIFIMSDKGYLSNKREQRLAKILDGLFDFNTKLKGKKILWGLINLGSALEKNDYKMFLFAIRILDDGILAKGMNLQAAAVLDKALTYLENKDIDGFNNYVADLLAGAVDLPLVTFEREIFLSVLNLFKNLLGVALQKVDEAITKAETEAIAKTPAVEVVEETKTE